MNKKKNREWNIDIKHDHSNGEVSEYTITVLEYNEDNVRSNVVIEDRGITIYEDIGKSDDWTFIPIHCVTEIRFG